MENNKAPEANTASIGEATKRKRNPLFGIILGILIIAGGFWGYHRWQYSRTHEATDDAQVASNLSPVISKVSGYINEVRVKDNQFVHKGDTLIILDNRDQLMHVQQALAALQTAKTNVASAVAGTDASIKSVSTSKAGIATIEAQIAVAKVNVWRTGEDLKRYENLIKDHSITQQQYELVLAAKQSADKQLQVLIEQQKQAIQQTGAVASQSVATSQNIGVANAVVQQRQADVDQAQLNLSYTIITAKGSGFVSKVPVQPGQFVQAGAQLFSIVMDNSKWIVANFKETQVERMAEGQKVKIEIDAFPRHRFEGVISSFSPATGATFALLPPDNASGNFVKVVQRLPVKIDFSNTADSLISKIRTGMNVKVEVLLN